MSLSREAEALRAVGMARRAGCVAVGTRAVREAARGGKLAAILIARDASENARGRLEGVRRRSGTSLTPCADRRALGAAVGRGPVAVLGVTERGLADLVLGPLGRSGDDEILRRTPSSKE
ncbi:MAG: ribosomal L7Ae/L30e/S12e/Gadd45 family protein [Gemmatimonadota bacterium]